jgi:hypothetical protein
MSTSNSEHSTPQERLEATRRALIREMRKDSDHGEPNGRSKNVKAGSGTANGSYSDAEQASEEQGDTAGVKGMWRTFSHTASVWWRAHPARLVVEVAEPVLGKYARAHPLKFLGIAAGVGAFVVVARPWRLVSLTGLLVGALKTTPVSAMVASMFMSDERSEDERQAD